MHVVYKMNVIKLQLFWDDPYIPHKRPIVNTKDNSSNNMAR